MGCVAVRDERVVDDVDRVIPSRLGVECHCFADFLLVTLRDRIERHYTTALDWTVQNGGTKRHYTARHYATQQDPT